jgi:hypothetical protein
VSEGQRAAVPAAIAVSVVLFALRMDLAARVGFGDAEALYACYAFHPQPAYLDHPGLVGVLFRWLSHDAPAAPKTVHHFTALLSTLLPWLGVVAARATGATWPGALRTFFAFALLPEMAIGLFALTPDVPLAVAWTSALAFAALALTSPPGSRTSLATSIAAGFAAGLAVQSKASGLLLAPAIALAFASRGGRAHLRSAGPWCGLVVFLILVWPLAAWEHAEGYPLLRHRLFDTQHEAGFSLLNLGKFAGGQLLYVTPPFLYAAYVVFRETLRRDDPVDRLLVLAAGLPGIGLALLSLWSRVAEPHWIAPAYLSLGLAAARSNDLGLRFQRVVAGTGAAVAVLAFFAVRTPLVAKVSGDRYVPRYDLTNDLYTWQVALPLVEEEVMAARAQSRKPVVVGPHWMICAQVLAGLGPGVPVGCRTKTGDDFERWLPPSEWEKSPTILYVRDDRFPEDIARLFADRDIVDVRSTKLYRGGKATRTVQVYRLERTGLGHGGTSAPRGSLARPLPPPASGGLASLAGRADVPFVAADYSAADAADATEGASAVSPAALRSSLSPSGPGFGVVRRRSP